jgi:hypothetical protein
MSNVECSMASHWRRATSRRMAKGVPACPRPDAERRFVVCAIGLDRRSATSTSRCSGTHRRRKVVERGDTAPHLRQRGRSICAGSADAQSLRDVPGMRTATPTAEAEGHGNAHPATHHDVRGDRPICDARGRARWKSVECICSLRRSTQRMVCRHDAPHKGTDGSEGRERDVHALVVTTRTAKHPDERPRTTFRRSLVEDDVRTTWSTPRIRAGISP